MQSYEAKVRKQQTILICSGLGIILFGVWSIVRLLLVWYLDRGWLKRIIGTIDEIPQHTYEMIIFVLILIVLFIDLSLRSYIGLSAIKEGQGIIKKRYTYIIIASVIAVTVIIADITVFINFFKGSEAFDDLTNAIVDFTTNIATIEIVISAIRLRKLLNEGN